MWCSWPSDCLKGRGQPGASPHHSLSAHSTSTACLRLLKFKLVGCVSEWLLNLKLSLLGYVSGCQIIMSSMQLHVFKCLCTVAVLSREQYLHSGRLVFVQLLFEFFLYNSYCPQQELNRSKITLSPAFPGTCWLHMVCTAQSMCSPLSSLALVSVT